jgi:hypothetical protein
MARVLWILIFGGLAVQVLALACGGHRPYLWVQGAEAAVAAVVVLGFWIAYRRRDPRASRWPPLLPLAFIAGTGAAKDFCVASEAPTPPWLAGLLLASVGWFLASTWYIWRTEGRSDGRQDESDKKP